MTAMLAGLVGPLAACSEPPPPQPEPSDAGVVDAGPPPFTSDEVCDRFAVTQCALLTRCFPAFNRFETNDCIRDRAAACVNTTREFALAVEDGRTRLDEERVEACIGRMKDAFCPAALAPTAVTPGSVMRAFEDCTLDSFFVGNVEAGQGCQTTRDCLPGASCKKFAGTCGGVCTPYPQIGERCGTCDPATSYCDQTSLSCTALKGEAVGCKEAKECQTHLDCRLGQCLPAPPLFSPCVFSAERLPYCGAGLACDVAPYIQSEEKSEVVGECVLRRVEGDRCNYHWTCRAGLVCAGMDWSPFPESAPGAGVCARARTENEKCSFNPFAQYLGDECAPGLSCDPETGRCLPPPREGEPCSLGLQNCVGEGIHCKSDELGGGICGLAPGIGEGCQLDLGGDAAPLVLPCRDGYCDRETDVCTPANLQEREECYADRQCLTGRCVVQEDKSLRCGKRC